MNTYPINYIIRPYENNFEYRKYFRLLTSMNEKICQEKIETLDNTTDRETIDEIWKAVPYCVDLLGGPYIDMRDDVCNAFRPKSARRR